VATSEESSGSESEISAADGQRFRRPRDRGADVGRHVVGTFRVVLVVSVLRRETREERLQIAPHRRVSVLLHDQRCAGVLHTDVAQARPHASRLHDAADRFRHVVEPLAARLDPDRLLMHLHARSQRGSCGPSTRPRSLSCGRKRPLYSSEAQPSTR